MDATSLDNKETTMALRIEIERETDGRWIAEIPQLPGVMVYGESESEAVREVEALALRVLADRVSSGIAAGPLPPV
jgi:predicted RNase H-like HicB family nuclease